MRTFALWLLTCLVPFSTACRSEPATPGSGPVPEVVTATLGTAFDLDLGQTARVGDSGLTLVFQSVEEDSRCPTGVACVWAGNGRILLGYQRPGEALRTTELNTTVDPGSQALFDWRIELVELRPWPVEGVPTEGYVARLQVTGM